MMRFSSGLLIIALLALPCPVPAATGAPVATVTEAAAPPAAVRSLALFKEPIEPAVFELSVGALAAWRNFAEQKPTLVLFSTHPFLNPLPPGEGEAIRNFVHTAPAAELVRRGRFNVPDPAFLPPQAVSAAIEAGLLGELIFVLPTTKTVDKFALADFQQRAFAAGFLSEPEALDLKSKAGVISGKVRGIPFRCVHPNALPKLDRPVIVHIDLGYFKDLYVNDVKTPVYNLLYQTARSIRDTAWPALAVTLSYSNQEAEFSLATRFMISNLATILQHPELLEGGTPPSWKLLADARFAAAMFAETTAQELITRAAEVAPDDPDALYTLSQQLFQQLQPAEAFATLDRAVAIDPGYALAYLELAETGAEQGRWEKTEEMLAKARLIFPNNPFIAISQADLLIRRQRGQEAVPLLNELQQLPWSPVYHPNVPDLLRQMLAAARETSVQPRPEKPAEPAAPGLPRKP